MNKKYVAALHQTLKEASAYKALWSRSKKILLTDVIVPFRIRIDKEILHCSYSELTSVAKYCLSRNVLVIGAAGMGKTFFLKALTCFITKNFKVVSILLNAIDMRSSFCIAEAIMRKYEIDISSTSPDRPSMLVMIDDIEDLPKEQRHALVNSIQTSLMKDPAVIFCVALAHSNSMAPLKEYFTLIEILSPGRQIAYALWSMLDLNLKKNVWKQTYVSMAMGFRLFKEFFNSPQLLTVFYFLNLVLDVNRKRRYNLSLEPAHQKQFDRKVRYISDQFLIRKFKQQLVNKPWIVVSNHKNDQLKTLPVVEASQHDLVIVPVARHLGDLLMHSHLPRLVKESGKFDRVLIEHQAQNEFVWNHNHYVDGYCCNQGGVRFELSGQDWNRFCFGYDQPKVRVKNRLYYKDELNVLDWLMLNLEIDDGKRFHRPEVYYKPILLKEFDGASIYDPYWKSNPRVGYHNFELINDYFKRKEIYLDFQMRFSDDKLSFNSAFKSIPTKCFHSFLSTVSIYDFYDVLASSTQLYCLTTGTLHLADTLNLKTTVLTDERLHMYGLHHSKFQKYVDVTV